MRLLKFRSWDGETLRILSPDELAAFLRAGLPISQFTGLQDKNGKDIYEGDIVEYWDGSVESVTWNKEGFWSGWGTFQLAKVIGNIYQHPELLEKQ